MYLQNKAQSSTTVVTNVRLMSVTRHGRGSSDPITSREVLSSWFIGYTPSPGKVIPIPMGLIGWYRAILESKYVDPKDKINILHDVQIVEFDKTGRLCFNCSVDMINREEGGFFITIVVKETKELYRVVLTNSQLKIEQVGVQGEILYHHKLERYIGPAKANYWMDPISHMNTGVVLDRKSQTHTIPIMLTDRVPVDYMTLKHVIQTHFRALGVEDSDVGNSGSKILCFLEPRHQRTEEIVTTNHGGFSMLLSLLSMAVEDIAIFADKPDSMTRSKWLEVLAGYTNLFVEKLESNS